MIININKDREVINDYSIDKEIYSTKIVDEIPSDINEYVYKYINGVLIRDRIIDTNYKSQEQINNEQIAINEAQTLTNNEQDEFNVDLDYRVTMLELGM